MTGIEHAVADGVHSGLLVARIQMALTLGFHIILACLGVGLPVMMLFAEWRFLRTGDRGWKTLARRWSKAFTVLFAVGAVTGTILSFELGLLWPEFMGTFGAVIGLPFTLEAFAFFLEAIFLGIYLYTWDYLPPRWHWLSGFPVAVAGLASAWLVVTANAWMNTPRGFEMTNGVVTDADPVAVMLNPATATQTTHMILAAYFVSGFLVASVYAVAMLQGKNRLYHRRALSLALALGALCAPLQLVVGDASSKMVGRTQPAKLAAMEGQFRTQAGAPLRIGGFPDEQAGETRWAIEIPKMLSWLVHGDADAVIRGLDDFPPENKPPAAIVHLSFQLMVAIGAGLTLLSGWAGWALWRRRLPEGRTFLWLTAVSGPLAVVALECGWVVTEVGRQPWIVQGIMRTAEAVTDAPGIPWVLAALGVVYGVLTVGLVASLRFLARKPLPEAEHAA
jgi:cytochrome d ubiquinol oxidase subunit I